MNEALPALREPFSTPAQQLEADRLGMWLFLASEAMLFAAVFLTLAVYHLIHPAAMHAATGRLDLAPGAIGTALLLTSSTSMALAVRAARRGGRGETILAMAVTLALGFAFEAIKLLSWIAEYHQGLLPGRGPPFPLSPPAAKLFFDLYFVSTGIHALHLAAGILLVGWVGLGVLTGTMKVPERSVTVEMAGLYWQFVDVVWILLFPTLYLVSR